MNDGNESGGAAPGEVAATAVGPAFTMLSTRTLNKHAECDRTAINETLQAHNDDGWSLVGQPVIIGSHVDLWFERVVIDEPEEPAAVVTDAPAAEENPAAAEENPAADSEASPG